MICDGTSQVQHEVCLICRFTSILIQGLLHLAKLSPFCGQTTNFQQTSNPSPPGPPKRAKKPKFSWWVFFKAGKDPTQWGGPASQHLFPAITSQLSCRLPLGGRAGGQGMVSTRNAKNLVCLGVGVGGGGHCWTFQTHTCM